MDRDNSTFVALPDFAVYWLVNKRVVFEGYVLTSKSVCIAAKSSY
jgi:hypothetical protein